MGLAWSEESNRQFGTEEQTPQVQEGQFCAAEFEKLDKSLRDVYDSRGLAQFHGATSSLQYERSKESTISHSLSGRMDKDREFEQGSLVKVEVEMLGTEPAAINLDDNKSVQLSSCVPNSEFSEHEVPVNGPDTCFKGDLSEKSLRGETCTCDVKLHGTEMPNGGKEKGSDQSSHVAWEIDIGSFDPKKRRRGAKAPNAQQSQFAGRKQYQQDGAPNSMSDVYIEAVQNVSQSAIAGRKVLDVRRWFCISRPQYKRSCGMSSLVSCWNFLFSSIGAGSLRPISQEEAMTILGFTPPFGQIRFGPFTGNATLMRWFKQLCDHYGVRGRSYYLYKPKGKCRTVGLTGKEALKQLQKGLSDPQTAFIYHCHNHYFCPIGYEDTPVKALDAYRSEMYEDEVETWVLIGDTSCQHPTIQCKRWRDIDTDLNCENPQYLNIRQVHKGIQERKTKRVGGNLHCIMAFQRSTWQGFKKSTAPLHVPPQPSHDNHIESESSEESTREESSESSSSD